MYKKALNFTKSTDIFWKKRGPLTINYNPALSSTKLNNVDVLLTDINTGYMLGWVSNNKIAVNANINMEKYCICTWIDESAGTQQGKEKYMPGQDVELINPSSHGGVLPICSQIASSETSLLHSIISSSCT